MADEVRHRNGDIRECAVVGTATNGVVVNGFGLASGNGGVCEGSYSGSSSEGFQTYKRRKHTKMSDSESKLIEDGKVSVDLASQHTDKNTEEPMDTSLPNSSFDQVSFQRMKPCTTKNGLNDCPLEHWRHTVLEHIYQSLVESDGGIQGCIRDALVFHPESSCTTAAKESIHFNEDSHKCSSESGRMSNEFRNSAKGHMNVKSSGLLNESDRHTTTELCQFAFFDIITSEMFAQLCKLLSENFQGLKLDGFFNVDIINSRMKEGAYESKPMLFFHDIQEAWTKLQKVGTEMVALAKSLSDKSRTSFHDQVGHLVHSSFEDNEVEFLAQEPNLHSSEQTEVCGVYKVCACRRCGEKADGGDCLVCDSCEEMYHVSCIEPAVEEIPLKNWYCSDCTAKGIDSPHENCVACETLNATTSPINEVGDDVIQTSEVTPDEMEQGSNGLVEDGLQPLKGDTCNMCGGEVEIGEKIRLCGHSFCPHKYYHERCLTSKQLKFYGPSWYCPSCLCGACLTDRDDDKIVLCDGCDLAYHIYCLQPPRASIPDGSWFCRKCDAEIRRIRKAKRTYENIQNNLKKSGGESGRKGKHEDMVDGSGGVDMLLTAAKTLNFEEKMASSII
ncbi:PHD finger protein EHD3-like [Cornus florida]|uniref:PHD finger protein EHD3-like n=1 Tax=Cornus florida TaxID=4283 RepID=UPI0028A1B875|nr:PHD finger protein EHD3-like [Cornus florida]